MLLLGLGSNLSSSFGDRFDNINIALSYLEAYQIKIIKKSSFYESLSYPNNNDPKFINIIIEILTDLPPEDLVSVLIFIEEKLGRKRIKKNEPRTCDIDIIDYDGKIMDFSYKGSVFKVPHEKLIYRNFVLFPIQEIAPIWKHPETKDTINELINKLSVEDKKSILKIKKS
tara:strand:- start:150 stop:662 length:513 start_codon:yes stop_codon:yes gene_type:complete